MIAAILTTRTANERILRLIIGTTVGVKHSAHSVCRTEFHIAEFAYGFGDGACDIGLVDVEDG